MLEWAKRMKLSELIFELEKARDKFGAQGDDPVIIFYADHNGDYTGLDIDDELHSKYRTLGISLSGWCD